MKARTRLLACYVIGMTLVFGVSQCAEASEEYTYRVNYLPWSVHHGQTNATNETHNGIGLSMTDSEKVSYGIMYYENSYEDWGWLASIGTEFDYCPFGVCPGFGMAFAPAYRKSDNSILIGWASLRYKWVTVLTAPGEATAVMLSVPLKW